MSRIKKVMLALKEMNKTALIPYITGGDPNPGMTVNYMHELVNNGADILEIGVPFSDPMADGPTIQLACERALKHNTSLNDILEMISVFRVKDSITPVVLMGYLNPVEAMGYALFVEKSHDAGVDGVLLVDLPPEEAESILPLLTKHNIDSIFLISPTTTDKRIDIISKYCTGYVYYVSVKGVTGSSELDVDDVRKNIERIRKYIDVPVAVGFGIKDGPTAAKVALLCEGVIIGSVIVNKIAEYQDEPEIAQLKIGEQIATIRSCLDH
jgi:tryptophan synthase alpha chain